MGKGGAQNRDLPRLKVSQILQLQSPLDVRIASESSGSGAGNVGENAVEARRKRKLAGIGNDRADVGFAEERPEQASAVRMQIGCNDRRVWIPPRENRRLAARCCATVENPVA